MEYTIAKCRACMGDRRSPTKAGGAAYGCQFCAETGFDFDSLPDPRVKDVLNIYSTIVSGSKSNPKITLIPQWLIEVHREGNRSLNGWLHSGLFDGGEFSYAYLGNFFNGYYPGLQIFMSSDKSMIEFSAYLIKPIDREFLIKVTQWAKAYVLTTFDPKFSKDPLDYIEL